MTCFDKHPRWRLLAASAAILIGSPTLAAAQSDDSDLLAPLVPPPSDDSDLLAPLVPPDDDLLEPLVPRKPRKPGKVTHKDELEVGPAQNGFILVKRKIVDPCGTFEISWGGRKTCHPYEREKWEYVAVGGDGGDDAKEGPNPFEDEDSDDKSGGRSPGGRLPPGPGAKGPGKMPGTNGPLGNGPGPQRPGAGEASGGTGTGAGSAPASGRGTGRAVVTVPAVNGFARLDTFAARLDNVAMDASGRFDVTLTVRNDNRATKLVANGDWTVTLTDADGLGFSSRDIWMPGTGAAKPFHLMPNVAPGGTQQVRFILEPELVRANIVSLSVQQGSAAPATFDISARQAGKVAEGTAPAPSTAPFGSVHKFDVRLDKAVPAGGKFELFFTARNRTGALQYLGGSNLTFTGLGPAGETVTSRRETYSVRGARGAPVRMAPVQPGAVARLRVLFDVPSLKGPFTVDDGIKRATLVALPVAPGAEPDW